ncbi:15225_t:CDS:2 [Gigaspora margarita]|uniref:15225_t:CDS:1 n=1 Tax=Gigaspora margarita TaxID=4874 RepID=A0ABM8W211_GIGMA|nr:15225_t:CDS:2 [Gigaspora margarita]
MNDNIPFGNYGRARRTYLGILRGIGYNINYIIGQIELRTNSYNWNNIFNRPSEFGAHGSGLIKVLLTYEGWNNINYLIGEFNPSPDNLEYPSLILKYSSLISVCISFISYCLTNAAFITVVGYNPNNSTDYESTPMPMRFGQELFGKGGENLMATFVAISIFGCVTVVLGLIIWYIRNRGQRVQNQTIGETSNDEKA